MLRASASTIKLISVYKQVQTETESQPFSYFLEVDGVRILLDCGWNDSFDMYYLEALLPYVVQADLVLLSSSDIIACGALPFVVQHLKPGAYVSAPTSVTKIGIHSCLHTFLYQCPSSLNFSLNGGEREFELNVDGIYSAFRSVKEPFGGKVSLEKNGVLVECTALFAGRLFGGYNWSIDCQIDSLFYCPDFSVKPSYLLKRMTFPTSASALFINSNAFHIQPSHATSKYEEHLYELFKALQQALRSGGDILIPVEVSSRGLEVLSIIHRLFHENGGDQYKILLASLQAREILDKAATMTEVLKNEVMLNEEMLFSNVITCKSPEEVVSVHSPKVCIADGESLGYGVAASLIKSFAENESSIILFTSHPRDNTVASEIVRNCEAHHTVEVKYEKRERLENAELEAYYRQLEEAAEAERQKLAQEGAFKVVDSDKDEVDELEEQTAAAAPTPAKDFLPGVYLPSYVTPSSKKLMNFPALEQVLATEGDADSAYGIPLSEEEKHILQQRAPVQILSDLKELNLVHDTQEESKIPSKIRTVTESVSLQCKVLIVDLSGAVDVHAFKRVMLTKLFFARKIVAIRGSAEDWRSLANFCRLEKPLKCGDNVFNVNTDVALELATQVLSYIVNIDPQLLSTVSTQNTRVRERNTKDIWEVNWLDGQIKGEEYDDEEPVEKKQRTEEGRGEELRLVEVEKDNLQRCAEHKEKNGLFKGSYFFGEAELNNLRDFSRRQQYLNCELHPKAPLLLYDDGVCVRKSVSQKGTELTVSSVATPNMFTVRQSVYKQFTQII